MLRRSKRELRERMQIPVFHDDQHGTAIIVAAAVRNGLVLQGKKIEEVKLVTSGAGAAALACLDLLVQHGRASARTSTLTDIQGVVYAGRDRKCWTEQAALRPGRPKRGRWRRCWPAPTSSSACRPRAC